jgi:hypothetical protein
MTDDTERRLDDIEKRLARLERAAEKPAVKWSGTLVAARDKTRGEAAAANFVQFCPCGRDVCRAPDCPSHRNDPLGR